MAFFVIQMVNIFIRIYWANNICFGVWPEMTIFDWYTSSIWHHGIHITTFFLLSTWGLFTSIQLATTNLYLLVSNGHYLCQHLHPQYILPLLPRTSFVAPSITLTNIQYLRQCLQWNQSPLFHPPSKLVQDSSPLWPSLSFYLIPSHLTILP